MKLDDKQRTAIEMLLADYNTTSSPGVVLAIGQGSDVLLHDCYGMANLDHDVAITQDTIFHVASVSKQFTAAAIALLVQDGQIDLDDPVSRYIGEFPDFDRKVTIRHLAHHTSGLRDQWHLLALSGWRYSRDLISNADVMSMIAQQRDLNFAPGSDHLYSNSGYTIMAEIVARVSGMSFREFTDKRIFNPLGMNQTFFRDNFREVVRHQAYGYVSAGGGYESCVTNFDTVGATSLMTTPADLLKWGANFSHRQVGGDVLNEHMLRRFTLSSGKTIDYAFGLRLSHDRGFDIYSHNGADAGYRANFVHVPHDDVTIALACNVPMAMEQVTGGVLDILYPDSAKVTGRTIVPEAIMMSPAEVRQFEGQFVNPGHQSAITMISLRGMLQAQFMDNEISLIPISSHRFLDQENGIEGEFTDDLATFTIVKGAPQPVEFKRTPVSAPTDEELQSVTGLYASEELAVRYEITLSDNNELLLSYLKNSNKKMKAVTKDVFSCAVGTVYIQRDETTAVSGFLLSTGRIRNLAFHRLCDRSRSPS